eukprot:s896_g20.t1
MLMQLLHEWDELLPASSSSSIKLLRKLTLLLSLKFGAWAGGQSAGAGKPPKCQMLSGSARRSRVQTVFIAVATSWNQTWQKQKAAASEASAVFHAELLRCV